ncbi:hypothetical protein FD15_GL000105 [Liquorilactobacillus sucicola DSM 21376 = JCM 15457]|uniref:WxL domain-containing protein n=1 Tax=Liquorilactobacillus sucicola DSM 21376 = JCM 15457 TaxID=1423806 RepID=A0A0R2DRE0_9LACO|nr:WxL domain-containing protein [Liquorilactobacillus sucicola]KRN06558.1 hypothetical protein FD15_GL000105 [Liquorilactobacillus sucicola DSM 21376 = JCM 15457]
MKKSGRIILAWLIILFSLSTNIENGQADNTNSQASFNVYAGDASADNLQREKLNQNYNSAKAPPKGSIPDNDYNGSLKLNAVPDLNFGKVNLSAIYNGAKIRLHNGNSDKINRIIVADYRGYNRSQRGWSVNAYITPLTNGPFTITPTITLKLKPAALNVTTPTAITLSAKTATPVLTSLKIPTNGIRSATVLTRGSSTLNFNTLTRTQRENFQPGKYHGRIIWTLNNTASDD